MGDQFACSNLSTESIEVLTKATEEAMIDCPVSSSDIENIKKLLEKVCDRKKSSLNDLAAMFNSRVGETGDELLGTSDIKEKTPTGLSESEAEYVKNLIDRPLTLEEQDLMAKEAKGIRDTIDSNVRNMINENSLPAEDLLDVIKSITLQSVEDKDLILEVLSSEDSEDIDKIVSLIDQISCSNLLTESIEVLTKATEEAMMDSPISSSEIENIKKLLKKVCDRKKSSLNDLATMFNSRDGETGDELQGKLEIKEKTSTGLSESEAEYLKNLIHRPLSL